MTIENVKDLDRIWEMSTDTFSLDPRYQETTQKCLRYHLRHDVNLAKPALPNVIYKSVVGKLEAMISSLSLDDENLEGEE